MYHGTRVQNLVGILTRGILLPKVVTSLGISRTVNFYIINVLIRILDGLVLVFILGMSCNYYL